MAKLLTAIARSFLDNNSWVDLTCFYRPQDVHWWGYCNGRLWQALNEEARVRKHRTIGQCIGEATQDDDLRRAFTHTAYEEYRHVIAAERHRHDFAVVLAHEIKSLLMAACSTAGDTIIVRP